MNTIASLLRKSFAMLSQSASAVSILLTLCVISLLSWQHVEQRALLRQARLHMLDLRQAQIDLSKGFLQASLAENAGSSPEEHEGVVLLRQAVSFFDRSLRNLAAVNVEVGDEDAEEFRKSADEFQRLLQEWRRAPEPDGRSTVLLRIAFGDLERRAGKVDLAAQRQMNALSARSERVYLLSLTGSFFALIIILILMFRISRKERQAISAQARTNRTLIESEGRYRSLLENLEGAVYRCRADADWTLEFASEGCLDLVGYRPADLLAQQPGVGELIHPEDRPALWQAFRDGIAHGRRFQVQLRMLHADGSWRWVLGKGHAVRGPSGKVLYIDGFATDITVRKTAELALVRMNEELEARVAQRTTDLRRANEEIVQRGEETRSLLANLVDVVILIDSRGIVRSANPALTRVLGYTPEELIGKNVSMLMPAHHAAAHDGYVLHYLQTGEARIIGLGRGVEGRHKDGHLIQLELAVNEFRVQDERYFTGILRDITARKQAMAEQNRLTDLLNNVLAAASEVAIIATDRSGLITIFNSGAERMLGYRAEEVIGKSVAATIHMPEEMAARRAELHAELGITAPGFRVLVEQAERNGSEMREWTYVRKSGERVPVSLVVTPMRSSSGGITGYLGIAQPIGERRRIMAELEHARQKAEAANQAKSAFLATMSHEVRTPMNGIIGIAEVLTRRSPDGYEAELVGTIRDSALSLLSIIDDILDFSKIEADRMELEREQTDVKQLLEKAANVLRMMAAQNNVRLRFFADPLLPDCIAADPLRLRQIVFNLLSNAIKFAGGREMEGIVRLGAERTDDGRLCLTVQDNGIGMSAEVLTRIFSPFTQADASTTRRFGGTGLGLSICKRLVDLMAGTISVESRPGAGTTFTVVLPMEVDEPCSPVTAPPDLSRLNVAIVARDATDGSDWSRYLAWAGAAANHYPDAATALRALGQPARSSAILILEAEREECEHLLEQELAMPAVVRIGGNEQRFPCRESGTTVHLGGAISCSALCQAVAIAAGRASPEPDPALGHVPVPGVQPAPVEEAAARRRLILVAEDNETNRKVIQFQLQTLGYTAEFAEDGTAAYALWQTGRHALLITDLHMPGMDGYALAAAIRREARSPVRMPIIAFTANNMRGESVRCLEAGMDDFLPKPVMLDQLLQTLQKWLPPETAPAAAIPRSPVLDTRVLARLVGDDPATIAEFLADFGASVRKHAQEVLSAVEQENWRSATLAAHKLKSSARAVGALGLGDNCASLEAAGKDEDAARVRELASDFKHHLAAVTAALESQETERLP